jgi:hypothetical protein
MHAESEKALDQIKTFLANNEAAAWADPLVATLVGLDVDGVNVAVHKAADELHAGLLREEAITPTLAFGMTTAFVSMVHDTLLAKLGEQAAKPTSGRSPWQRWQLQ